MHHSYTLPIVQSGSNDLLKHAFECKLQPIGNSVRWPVLGLLSATMIGKPQQADHLVAEITGVS